MHTSIKDKITQDICAAIYKYKNNLYPENLMNIPIVNNDTRQRDNIYVPAVKTDVGGRSLLVNGPKLYNALPTHIKEAATVKSFKLKLQKILFNNNIP